MKNSVFKLSHIVGAVASLLALYFFLTGEAALAAAFTLLGVAVVVAFHADSKKINQENPKGQKHESNRPHFD
jgi:hypothetical protein